MKAAIAIVALGIVASAGVGAAEEARPLGVVTLDLENKANARKVTSEFWYEAASDSAAQPFATNPVFRAMPLARNAAPAAQGKRPLVIVSHGNWGTRFSQGWLAAALTQAGYIVLSTSHPGTLGNDQTAAGRFRLWDRSTDVSFALDEVLKDPKWSALIDETRIGFVGHSFGGWTGLSLAGARYEPARQLSYCEHVAKKDYYCSQKDDISGIPVDDASRSYKDARIKAFYVMASGPGKGFTDESLRAIRAPIVFDTAQFDEVLEPQANSSDVARQVPGAKEVVRPAGHFAYVPVCNGRPPASAGVISQICADPEGVDRAQVHAQAARDVVAFFAATLSRRTGTAVSKATP
jgi:predicted dienelactone hydrolase